ncbi:MAG TPA: protein-L-isoaspartate(D-aspartate) O-methyltransferase [SAR202 cluster bacterium]|nr:protein-L-isoaspartate(D-aspartate) O-methyltransferase [SAR202 cluster bacterium]
MSSGSDKIDLFERISADVGDDRVIEAMRRVPREAFVAEASAHVSYADLALPIACGQTISQPYIVALSVSALEIRRMDRVLELGTGSGYQAAVLAELAREVVTLERIEWLAETAKIRLASLGYDNVIVRPAEDALGSPDDPPFNAIVVAAAAPRIPNELVAQLEIGGRMVVPVGSRSEQELMKLTRTEHGYSMKTLGACRFVPLIGEGAWSEHDDDDP